MADFLWQEGKRKRLIQNDFQLLRVFFNMRIFLLCRGYPSQENLYNYPFLHRRVLWYQTFGHDVCIFVLSNKARSYVFEGCRVDTGDNLAMKNAVANFAPDCIAAHGIADDLWVELAELPASIPVYGWVHGSEFIALYKTNFPDPNDPRRLKQQETHLRRKQFWRELVQDWPANLKLVFVSRDAAGRSQRDVDCSLPPDSWCVLHNPVDTDLFDYMEKPAEQRFKVLSIRPYTNWTYANDLAAEAIVRMSAHSLFDRFSFRMVGDGELFEQVLGPLRQFKNVTLERRFLTQTEISAAHKENGVFLVPTRADTQGVSRDEAMSSGMVPVTNAVAAVPEFLSPCCGHLAPPSDAAGLAGGMLEMAQKRDLFLERSRQAAARVRSQSAANIIIPAELALLMGKKA